jgi:hypothetical protein
MRPTRRGEGEGRFGPEGIVRGGERCQESQQEEDEEDPAADEDAGVE